MSRFDKYFGYVVVVRNGDNIELPKEAAEKLINILETHEGRFVRIGEAMVAVSDIAAVRPWQQVERVPNQDRLNPEFEIIQKRIGGSGAEQPRLN